MRILGQKNLNRNRIDIEFFLKKSNREEKPQSSHHYVECLSVLGAVVWVTGRAFGRKILWDIYPQRLDFRTGAGNNTEGIVMVNLQLQYTVKNLLFPDDLCPG